MECYGKPQEWCEGSLRSRKELYMTERRKEEKSAAQVQVEETLKAALEKEMGEIPKVSITPDELRALETEKRRKGKRRIAKVVSVAAIAVIVCAAAVYVAWPKTAVPVDADKNVEQNIDSGDGKIIINEGEGVGEVGITEITETDWDKVPEQRENFPELAIPEFVPKGYEFQELTIEKYEADGFWAQYVYKKSDELLYFEQREYAEKGINTGGIENTIDTILTSRGDVYITESDQGNKLASLYTAKGTIRINGNIKDDEIVKIIEKTETH